MTEYVKIPTPTGDVNAELVNVLSCTDAAVECKLSDDTTLLIRPVITSVAKAQTPDGKTNYFVRIQNVIEKKQ